MLHQTAVSSCLPKQNGDEGHEVEDEEDKDRVFPARQPLTADLEG